MDIRDPTTHCPICKTRFTVGICTKCGRPVEYYRANRRVCRECYDTKVRQPDAMKKVKQRREAIFDEWLDKVARVPKNYPTLTEAQWLEAVKHFGCCAMCGSEHIDTRGYFIPFKLGGRYCDWNVIPICEKCAFQFRKNPNFFLRQRPAGLINIIDYLEEKLNAAIRQTEGAGQHAGGKDNDP